MHLIYWYIQCMHLLQKGKVSEVAQEHIDPVRKLVKVAKSSELFRSIGKWGINAVRTQTISVLQAAREIVFENPNIREGCRYQIE